MSEFKLNDLKKLVTEQVRKYARRAYNQKLWESHVISEQYTAYDKRMYDQENLRSLFKLDEKEIDKEKVERVIELIKSDSYENPSPDEFLDSLEKSDKPEMLTPYSTSELGQMSLYKLKDHDIGFALKEFTNPVTDKKEFGKSEIVAVHNNEPGVGGIGKILMQSAIGNGGCYLDHFDGFLSKLYGDLGFKEYMRYEFNPDYAPKDFEEKYGRQDVIYRFHPNCQEPNVKPEQDEEKPDEPEEDSE